MKAFNCLAQDQKNKDLNLTNVFHNLPLIKPNLFENFILDNSILYILT